MRRRQLLLLAGTGPSFMASGCLSIRPSSDSDEVEPPEPDCDEASRPEPDDPGPDTEDALGPTTYPEKPTSFDDDTLLEYAEAYERAYRRNTLVEQFGDRLRDYDLIVRDIRVEEEGEGAVVRIEYTFSETYEDAGSDATLIGDSGKVVAYYVDESVLVRAETDRSQNDSGPDPLAQGTVLECFE